MYALVRNLRTVRKYDIDVQYNPYITCKKQEQRTSFNFVRMICASTGAEAKSALQRCIIYAIDFHLCTVYARFMQKSCN